jgi:hypothetical protein
MKTSSWIRTAHRKARYATIVSSPLANHVLEEVSCSFVKEWSFVFGSPFPKKKKPRHLPVLDKKALAPVPGTDVELAETKVSRGASG